MISNRKRSQRQERRLAEKVGGKVTPASGALWHQKGDVRSEHFLIEAKTTRNKQYTLKYEDLQKISHEAAISGKTPVFAITFEGVSKDFAVIPFDFIDCISLDGNIQK